jgi:hypothetical protein
VAQRFTAATIGLFSVPALAAEGDCGAHKEFFSKLFSRGDETATLKYFSRSPPSQNMPQKTKASGLG